MFDTCILKFPQNQTHVVSTLLKWGGEKELQGIFQKGAIFCGDTLKSQIIIKLILHHWPKDFCLILWSTTGFAMKWHVRKKQRNSILMPSNYPDLGSASNWLKEISQAVRPIRSITQMDDEASWVWNFCTYFLDVFSQENNGDIVKCRLFSHQAGLKSQSSHCSPDQQPLAVLIILLISYVCFLFCQSIN